MQENLRTIEQGSPIPAMGWHGRLLDAASSAEVVELTRTFVASLTPQEMAALPRDCRPGKIVDAEDVHAFAYALVRRSCASDRMGDGALMRLASFFTDAARQLSRLAAYAPQGQ